MRRFLVLLSVLVGIESLKGLEVPVVFTLEPDQKTVLGQSYSTGGSDQGEIFHTGTIEALLSLNPETLEVSGVRFTGGRVHLSDIELRVTTDLDVFDLGIIRATFVDDYRGLSKVFTSGDGFGAVDFEGYLDPQAHLEKVDRGVWILSTIVEGQTDVIEWSFTEKPAEFFNPTMVSLERISEGEIRATLTQFISTFTTGSVWEGDTDAESTVSEQGTLISSGTFTLSSPFQEWAAENGLENADENSVNEVGQPHALLFALDLSASTSILPLEFGRDGELATLKMTLPAGGTQSFIDGFYTTDLENGPWIALPLDEQGSPTGIELGSSGEVFFQVPQEQKMFFRFSSGI